MERGQSGHRYILGGEAISLGKVLSAVGAVTGRKALRVPIPAGIARTAAAVMEFVSDMLRIARRQEQWRECALRCALNRYRLRSGVTLAMRRNPIGPALRETVASLVRTAAKFDNLVDSHR
jgi:dihydroflavonol-4-reductase